MEDDDEVDHAVGRPVSPVRRAEPVGHHPVLADTVQDAVGPDDRGVDRAREHQKADDDDERLEEEAQRERAYEVHRDAADEVVEVLRAYRVGDDGVGEEGDERGEQKRVDEDDHPRLHQILMLRVLQLAVDLRQRLLARHGEERVAERHQDADQSDERARVHRQAVARLRRCGFGRGRGRRRGFGG